MLRIQEAKVFKTNFGEYKVLSDNHGVPTRTMTIEKVSGRFHENSEELRTLMSAADGGYIFGGRSGSQCPSTSG